MYNFFSQSRLYANYCRYVHPEAFHRVSLTPTLLVLYQFPISLGPPDLSLDTREIVCDWKFTGCL